MLENIRGHSRGSIPPLRMPSLLPHDLCHEWNVSRRLPAQHQQSLCSVSQLCLTLWNPIDCSPLDSSIHGIFLARILEWIVISSSRASSRPRDWTYVSCISRITGGSFITESQGKPIYIYTMEYYLVIKRKEVVKHSIIWMNLEYIMLRERYQTKKAGLVWFNFYEMSRTNKSTETESRSEVFRVRA